MSFFILFLNENDDNKSKYIVGHIHVFLSLLSSSSLTGLYPLFFLQHCIPLSGNYHYLKAFKTTFKFFGPKMSALTVSGLTPLLELLSVKGGEPSGTAGSIVGHVTAEPVRFSFAIFSYPILILFLISYSFFLIPRHWSVPCVKNLGNKWHPQKKMWIL